MMTEFAQDGLVLVRGFLDPANACAIAAYVMKYRVAQADADGQGHAGRHEFYGDPVTDTLVEGSMGKVEKISGRELFPTLSFLRVSTRGDELTKHVDRPAGEISATVNLAAPPTPWPIWMRYLDRAPRSFMLMPGDAVVYQGCLVEHWREPLQQAGINAQCTLHYVDRNGPHAHHKWDGRAALNIPGLAPRS